MAHADKPRLRVGIIGCGRVVERFHLPALTSSRSWTVAAASDVNAERRRWFEQNLGGVPVFAKPEQMLEAVELDAALVATHPELHADLAAMAVAHGLHALVEKPGGTSLPQAQAMIEAARLAGTYIWVSYNRRFMSNYVALGATLGSLQNLPAVRGRFALSFDPERWDSVEGRMAAGPAGSGVAVDVAAHQLDALGWLTHRSVRSIEVSEWSRPPGQELLHYRVDLEGGWSIDCLARHGRGYQEQMLLEWDGGGAALFPTGIHRRGRPNRRIEHLVIWGKHWAHRKLIRLGLTEDVLARSFYYQWEAFAKAVGGLQAQAGATSEAVLSAHAGLQAIHTSWESGGSGGKAAG